jgi:hypothetical protein
VRHEDPALEARPEVSPPAQAVGKDRKCGKAPEARQIIPGSSLRKISVRHREGLGATGVANCQLLACCQQNLTDRLPVFQKAMGFRGLREWQDPINLEL